MPPPTPSSWWQCSSRATKGPSGRHNDTNHTQVPVLLSVYLLPSLCSHRCCCGHTPHTLPAIWALDVPSSVWWPNPGGEFEAVWQMSHLLIWHLPSPPTAIHTRKAMVPHCPCTGLPTFRGNTTILTPMALETVELLTMLFTCVRPCQIGDRNSSLRSLQGSCPNRAT